MNPHQLSLASRVARANETLTSGLDGETILLSTESSKYYGMDGVATRIWDITAQPIKVANIVQILIDEYKVEEIQCINDVLFFLQSLLKEKLLRIEECSNHD